MNTRSNRGDGEILDVQGVFPREGAGVGAVVVVLPNAVRQFSELSWEQAVAKSHGSRRPRSRRTLLVRPGASPPSGGSSGRVVKSTTSRNMAPAALGQLVTTPVAKCVGDRLRDELRRCHRPHVLQADETLDLEIPVERALDCRRRSNTARYRLRRSKVMLFARQRGASSNDHGAYRALL